MEFEIWQKEMLSKGYQKLFLNDQAKGSVSIFADSLKSLASSLHSPTEEILEETHELKSYADMYCLQEILAPIEKYEACLRNKERDESRKQIKEMALIVRDFKKMIFENCN